MDYEAKQRKRTLLGSDNNTLILLVSFMTLMFVILGIVFVIYQLSVQSQDNKVAYAAYYNEVLQYLQLPTLKLWLHRPWTLFTYAFAFTNFSFFSFVGTLLWLWAYGYILQDLTGNKKIIPLFLYGILGGGIAFLIITSAYPFSGSVLTGAGTGVMAVVIGTTAFAPNFKIYPMLRGGFPLWILTLIYVALMFGTVGRETLAGAVALIAAGLIGWLFTFQLKKGNDWSNWMVAVVEKTDDLFNPEKRRNKVQHYKDERQPFRKTTNLTEDKLNELLDKINVKGYASLTKEEKDFLNRVSKQ